MLLLLLPLLPLSLPQQHCCVSPPEKAICTPATILTPISEDYCLLEGDEAKATYDPQTCKNLGQLISPRITLGFREKWPKNSVLGGGGSD